jgi:hypothetical protein
MALSPGTRIGPYEILLALKLLPAAPRHDPDPLARFRREAQVLASLNHPNIATVHGFEEADRLLGKCLEKDQRKRLRSFTRVTLLLGDALTASGAGREPPGK